MDLAPATLVGGRYEVGAPLGRGSVGSAFRARDRIADVDVALKLVAEGDVALLQREFLVLVGIRHPRLARVFDFGYWRVGRTTRAYYTSAIVAGSDLLAYARGRAWDGIRDAVGDVLAALGALHQRAFLHGDIRPNNILVDPSGRAVVIDLSCARAIDGARAAQVSGTPGYLAPELLRGEVSASADLFALGRTLERLGRVLDGGLPRAIREVVSRLAADDPSVRIATPAAAAAALELPFTTPDATALLRAEHVGAEDAMSRIREIYTGLRSRERCGRVVVVAGDDGVGRTRLLEEATLEAQLVMTAARAPASALARALACVHDGAVPTRPSANELASIVAAIAASPDPRVLLLDDAHALDAIEQRALAIVLRSVPPAGSLVVVVATRDPSRLPPDHVRVALAPLDRAAVRSWLRAAVPESAVDAITAATAGYPKEIAALLTQLDGAAWDSRTLERAMRVAGTAGGPLDLADLDDVTRDALARVVASDPGPLKVAANDPDPGDLVPSFASLAARGLVVVEPEGVRLFRRSDAVRAERALGAPRMVAAHRRLAAMAEVASVADPSNVEARARFLLHLARAGDPRAEQALLATAPSPLLRPVIDVLAARTSDADVLRRGAEIYVDAGEPALALPLLARALRRGGRRGLGAASMRRLRRLGAQCYAQIGDSRRAIAFARRVLATGGDPSSLDDDGLLAAAALSLAQLKRGDDAEAVAVVRRVEGARAASAVPFASSAGALDLLLNAAFATSRLGDAAGARAYLARARPLAASAVARARFRFASATAFVEYRAGNAAAALVAYREALRIADASGLDDLVPSAALNVGTAAHQEGELGRAREAYVKGVRLATALGMPTTEIALSFNLARLHADIGSFDEARAEAVRARTRAEGEGMELHAVGAIALLAEIATAGADHATSEALLDDAEARSSALGPREVLEIRAQRVRADVAAGNLGAAARRLAGLDLASIPAPDVAARILAARGALALAEGRTADAIEALEEGAARAGESQQRLLVAESIALLADASSRAGAAFLAERHRARARELWERTLSTLPSELHAAFRAHPSRRATFDAGGVSAAASAPSPVAPHAGARGSSPVAMAVASERSAGESAARPDGLAARDVWRILEINRRLNSATTTTAVLEETMDAAITLTNAERGFLLVGAKAGDRAAQLKVTVARNIDRENLKQGHLKFSRTVAEKVVRTGQPVVAIDAAFDPRFAKAKSVHAMRLKSLLCVPIRSADGPLGAIYVDHRFSEGSFRPELADVLMALGDQAALAIEKARLLEELRTKTRELEERNADVERLARGQAVEIARLKASLDTPTPPRESRFDYGSLVARSSAMQRVLSILDRVIDADVTVLVRGESGTGKERIARAVHANGSRKGGPFVAINCGALPETLLEAELFGYRRGAFSGAVTDRAGLFVSAKGGTLFLDELGEMPLAMQVKLLRVLQEREVVPLGGSAPIPTDVRLVCATNRVLSEEVRAGRFREDLYYRVAVLELELPPLRERIEDILPLAESILERLATDIGRPASSLDRRSERALLAHPWPGNVRELENVLTKAYLLAPSTVIGAEDLALDAALGGTKERGASVRARIVAALLDADWNVVTACRTLGMPRATLYRKMRHFGIVRPPRHAD